MKAFMWLKYWPSIKLAWPWRKQKDWAERAEGGPSQRWSRWGDRHYTNFRSKAEFMGGPGMSWEVDSCDLWSVAKCWPATILSGARVAACDLCNIDLWDFASADLRKAGACSDGKGKRIPEEVLAAAAQEGLRVIATYRHKSATYLHVLSFLRSLFFSSHWEALVEMIWVPLSTETVLADRQRLDVCMYKPVYVI